MNNLNLENFQKYLDALLKNKTPKQNELIDMDLYMEQLIGLLNRLNFIYLRDFDDKIITNSMINNYVKAKIIDSPIKKKYQKKHVGQLIRLSFYKKILEINDCKKLFEFENYIYKKNTFHDAFVSQKESLFKQKIDELNHKIKNGELNTLENIHKYINYLLLNSFFDITICERLIDTMDVYIKKNNDKESN